MSTTWFVKDEIRKYCKRASDSDATSINQPLFGSGKWKRALRAWKPGEMA